MKNLESVSIRTRALVLGIGLVVYLGSVPNSYAEPDSDKHSKDIALQLQNPLAHLISVPFQNNWDFVTGKNDAMHYNVNVQPVIPISLTDKWNLITRTILPISHIESPVAGVDAISGSGDITQSFFLSPAAPVGGWIIGGGPVFVYPSASENALGSQKWSAGPTAVFLKQEKGWTYGILANHVWSFAGNNSRRDVSKSYMQPFLAYTTPAKTTYAVNLESTYDWEGTQWNVPVNFMVAQLVKWGSVPMQFQLGARYYFEKPDGGADLGARFAVTFLLPE